jgi:site-specific DNA-methyltransferase (cytosine-N4-specific)
MQVDLFWHSYDYFPYEKKLAEEEVGSVFSNVSDFQENGEYVTFSTCANGDTPTKIEQLTYFREGRTDGQGPRIPTQAKLEATKQNGGFEVGFDNELRCPEVTRQQTRYSAHGIHEYKGKFNPQIVRALGNILGLKPNDWLLDPFSGSGTTLLEAGHIGWNAVGIEINPMAVAISQAKIHSLHTSTTRLESAAEEIIESLNSRFAGLDFKTAFSQSKKDELVKDNWKDDINGYDYLIDWFIESVLVQLWAIQNDIRKIESEEVKLIHEVILSDLLRDVSQQDSGDLRTRREGSSPENIDVVSKYTNKLRVHIENVSKAEEFLSSTNTFQKALNQDTRSISESLPEELDLLGNGTVEFDAAITSPPYATALPYIDTHRLSLIFLGMIDPSDLRDTERSLIGTRNIKKSTRDAIYENIEDNNADLPKRCISLCRDMIEAVDPEEDGFRRQNKPALVYRYLRDMKEALAETRIILKTGAPFAMIVGPNETKLGGEEFVIDNPHLLEDLGKQVDYSIDKNLELDTHQRFGMHNSSYSIDTENLLVLRK